MFKHINRYPGLSDEDNQAVKAAQRQAMYEFYSTYPVECSTAGYAMPHSVPDTIRHSRFVLDGGLPNWYSDCEGYSEDGEEGLNGLLSHFGY